MIPRGYYDSAEGQLIANSCGYLTAARALRFSETWNEHAPLILRPTLHLVAHGVELLLKFPLVRRGATLETIRRDYGHELSKLWTAAEARVVRNLVHESATDVWTKAAASGNYPDEDFSLDPVQVLEAALERLGELHSRSTDFALRYVVAPNTSGPRPGFLIDAFGSIANRVMRHPDLVDDQNAEIGRD